MFRSKDNYGGLKNLSEAILFSISVGSWEEQGIAFFFPPIPSFKQLHTLRAAKAAWTTNCFYFPSQAGFEHWATGKAQKKTTWKEEEARKSHFLPSAAQSGSQKTERGPAEPR